MASLDRVSGYFITKLGMLKNPEVICNLVLAVTFNGLPDNFFF